MTTNAPPTEPGRAVPRNAVRRPRIFRYSAVGLLVALALLFCTAPFVEDLRWGDLIEAVLLTLVMVSAVVAVGGRRRVLIIALLLVAPTLAGKWANHLRPDLVPPVVFLAPGLLFVGFVALQLLGFILRARKIDSEVLCAAVAGYLLLGMLWAFGYTLLARLAPGSFAFSAGPPGQSVKGFTALYFSVITLSTVGYGDIVPVAGPARMLAMMEAMTGTFYVAILISRLVALYSSPPQSERVDGRNPAGAGGPASKEKSVL